MDDARPHPRKRSLKSGAAVRKGTEAKATAARPASRQETSDTSEKLRSGALRAGQFFSADQQESIESLSFNLARNIRWDSPPIPFMSRPPWAR